MNVLDQKICAWGGPFCAVCLGAGLVLAGFVPPPSPTLTADQIAALYQADSIMIRTGMLLGLTLLLTSSWFMANAVQQVRIGNRDRSTSRIAMTLLCACGFLVNKGIEWSQLIGARHTLLTNDFYMFFFMLTGIHALHVLIGMGVLTFLRSRIKSGQYHTGHHAPEFPLIESRAVFANRSTLVWLCLMMLTIVSRGLGRGMIANIAHARIAILMLAFVKVRYIGLEFMELRNAPRATRAAFEVWVVGVGGALAR
jgi:heme/copper-type cytochrome/quinol oxidase subunit 3